MNAYEKIRAALEQAGDYISSDLASERGAFDGYEGVSRIDEIKADLANNVAALSKLAELEKSLCRSSAQMSWEICGCQTQPTHYVGTMPCPLNPSPPAPVAEIREPTPEECERICTEYERLLMREGTCGGRDAFDAVRAVMWPKEGL